MRTNHFLPENKTENKMIYSDTGLLWLLITPEIIWLWIMYIMCDKENSLKKIINNCWKTRWKYSLFKHLKMFELYVSRVVSLFHQTSDKRLLRMNGEGIKSLTGNKNWSFGFSDPRSGRVEVGTESLLSWFISRKIDCQRFI